MTTVLANTSESGLPSGTSATLGSGGNTGGPAGDFLDQVNKGTGSAVTFDSTHAAHGTLAYKLVPGSGAVTCNIGWVSSLTATSITTVWFRAYCYFPSIPTANTRIFTAITSGGTKCAALVLLKTTGKLQWSDTASVTITLPSGSTFTNAVPTGQWVRIEGFVTGNATTGQVSASLYSTMDSATATETETSAATQNTAGTISRALFGPNGDTTAVPAFWVDDVAVSDTAALGPAFTAVTVADVGAVPTGSFTVTGAVPSSSIGAATDSLSVTVSVPLPEKGAAADKASITATVPISDRAGGTDRATASAAVPLAERAAAAEHTVISVTARETAASADQLVTAAAAPLKDAGAASDVFTPHPSSGQRDVAASADAIGSIHASGALTDSAGAADRLSVAASGSQHDVGAGVDVFTPHPAIRQAEPAAAADTIGPVHATTSRTDVTASVASLSISAAASQPDAGAATDTPRVTVLTRPADTAASADRIRHDVTPRLTSTAGAADILIATVDLPGEWSTGPAAPRWAISPAERWAAGAASPRWEVAMGDFQPIAAISLEYVNVAWTSDLAGTSVDPTTLTVQMAFPVSSGDPLLPAQPVTWYPATWLAGTVSKGWIAQCAIGPGGAVTLTRGQHYDVWSKISGTEVPAKYAGTLGVY